MQRKIIEIIEEKCDGCGQCLPECPEGAIQIIDGKARLISDLFCDGLGACIGHCPTGAIQVIEREAEPYDEIRVMENVARQGQNTIKAHLQHLQDHGQVNFLEQALSYLKDNDIVVPDWKTEVAACTQGSSCPGSQNTVLIDQIQAPDNSPDVPSALSHWPIQMHLVSPMAPQFVGSDLVLACRLCGFYPGKFPPEISPRKNPCNRLP